MPFIGSLRELIQNTIDGAYMKVGRGNHFEVIPSQEPENGSDICTTYNLVKASSPQAEKVAMIRFQLPKETNNDSIKNNQKGTLWLTNYGTTLPKSVLLMGGSSKTGSQEMRGKFGEGQKTGLVAIRRNYCGIQIHNGKETWHVDFKYNNEFNDPLKRRCLHITHSERAVREDKNYEVEITGLSKASFDLTTSCFLMLNPPRTRAKYFLEDRVAFSFLRNIKDIFMSKESSLNRTKS
jgi:hypothetical protein